MTDTWMAGLPTEVRRSLTRLLEEDLASTPALRSEIFEFRERIAAASKQREFLDRTLALQLAERCERFLDATPSTTGSARRRLAQTAVRYLLLRNDAEDDVDSIVGFDDDALVIDAIERELERLRTLGDTSTSE